MIAYVRGRLAEKSPSRAVVDVGGVGFDLLISLSTFEDLPAEGREATLFTLPYLREEKLYLYGFSDRSERDVFLQTLAVPGVGPKLALAVLSALRPDRFREAVLNGDTILLTRVPGIGKKSAERLVLELKGRFELEGGTAGTALPGGIAGEAILALEALGFRGDKAARAVERAASEGGGEDSTLEQLVREALRFV
ncbi:MAG: Holliday junction branch migration protein RuvA [Candidatus Eisenbacteria bacterium]|nr:Holliday junction branch migration protein RuvA [Candidatus Eisenbacteria bacterium]